METFVFCVLAAAWFFAGGNCRGVFECVTIMKTMQYWWPKVIVVNGKSFKYWSYELFVYNKDRNADGKTTWWEKTFPNDGGHRIKVLELLCYGIGATFLLLSVLSFPYMVLALPFIIWFIISAGFDISFSKFRYKP